MTALEALIEAYVASDPRLDIWRRYPDISEAEDAVTDGFACKQVSAGFAEFARDRDWNAVAVLAEGADHPLADEHAWVRITHLGRSYDFDWTARQYHDLHDGCRDKVLALPWPLVWPATGEHPVVGKFAGLGALGLAGSPAH